MSRAPSKEEIAKQRAAAAAEAAVRKEAEAKQREVVKKQLADLQAALKTAQDEAREATKEFK
jgi:flagellar motility protein MotE (MotC chaperone)